MSLTSDTIACHVRRDHEMSVHRYERRLLERLRDSAFSLPDQRPSSGVNGMQACNTPVCLAQLDSESKQLMRRESPNVFRAYRDSQRNSDYDSSDCYSDVDAASAETKPSADGLRSIKRSRSPAQSGWKKRILPSSTEFSHDKPSETKCLTWLLSVPEQLFQQRPPQNTSPIVAETSRGPGGQTHNSSTKSPTIATSPSRASSVGSGLPQMDPAPIRESRSHHVGGSQPQQQPVSAPAVRPKNVSRLSRGESLLVLDIMKPRATAGTTGVQLRSSYYCPRKAALSDINGQPRYLQDERRYQCIQCSRRFKNKNEAVRHQNSLHIRRQSWSCALLSTCSTGFHSSALSDPDKTTTDTCGYCGQEFSNQPADRNERADHLIRVHNFAQCCSDKKFFRADHFRQHLQHSHAAKSGKWLNVLEKTCESEEVPHEYATYSQSVGEVSRNNSISRTVSHSYILQSENKVLRSNVGATSTPAWWTAGDRFVVPC